MPAYGPRNPVVRTPTKWIPPTRAEERPQRPKMYTTVDDDCPNIYIEPTPSVVPP